MIRVNNYTQDYIDSCREQISEHIEAYRKLVTTARKQSAKNGVQLDRAIEAFEPRFFAILLLTLDSCFLNRSRGIEKKDGNPLNEVRMLRNAIVSGNGFLTRDRTIKYIPSRAVLKYRLGDRVRLTEASFECLCDAFFDEIEAKYLTKERPVAGRH